jgi:polyisoprenoid-binding protein YceI
MTNEAGTEKLARIGPSRSARKHHRWRWILVGTAALIFLAVVAAAVAIKFTSAPPSLALPSAAARAPAGALDGRWQVGAGSVAGFRVQESILGMRDAVAGRTHAVTGTITVSNGRVITATFRVDLAAIKVNGKAQPQFARSLGTHDDPGATFTLSWPVRLSSGFVAGATITVTGIGQLAMYGATRLVRFTVSGRRNGSALQAAGSIPVAFTRWSMKGPKGYGVFGSLASHGVAEFLLILHRR